MCVQQIQNLSQDSKISKQYVIVRNISNKKFVINRKSYVKHKMVVKNNENNKKTTKSNEK
jgi:hypothetical protein